MLIPSELKKIAKKGKVEKTKVDKAAQKALEEKRRLDTLAKRKKDRENARKIIEDSQWRIKLHAEKGENSFLIRVNNEEVHVEDTEGSRFIAGNKRTFKLCGATKIVFNTFKRKHFKIEMHEHDIYDPEGPTSPDWYIKISW